MLIAFGYIIVFFLSLLVLFYGLGWYASAGYLPAEKCGYGGEDGRQKILKEFPDADPNSIPDDAELQSKMMTILYEEYMDRLNRDF